MNRIIKLSSILVLAIASIFLTSCEKESVVSDEVVQNFITESVESVERSGNIGRAGCFEFVFPISITFPDGSTVSSDDYESLRSTIKTWKEANPEAEEKPTLGFPLDVIGEDGAVITVNSKDELRALKKSCPRNSRNNHNKGDRCFKVVFPLSISFPDGTSATFEDRMSLKTAIRAWKAENSDATERPMLAFPVDIELEDGTTLTINSSEELQAQKDSCAADN